MDKKTLEIQIKILANKALQQVKEFGDDIKNTADKAKGFTGDATKIAASIKSMQDAAKRTANQMKLFGMSSSDLRNTTQNLKKTILDLTEAGLKPESQEIQNLLEQYRELESQADRVEASEQGIFGVIGKLKNEIGSLAAVAAAVKIDKAVAGLASSTLEVNNSFQKIKDDFGIMLGDVEAGIGLFNELQEFNFWTPFDIEQTSQAAKVLVSAKVQLKDLTGYLTRFGDIAQGDAQKFQSYINAFSKASAKGKADMEVLNVFTDQGVQILDALGQQMGTTSAEIVKMASEGKISFQDLDNALKAMASEGGLYYGTLEKAAMRLDAVQAGLDESVKSLKASFGEMLAPAISAVLTVFTNWIDKINNSPILKGVLAAAIVTVTAAVNVLAVISIVKLITNLHLATVAAAGLGAAINTALPILGAVSVVIGVVTAAVVAEKAAHQKAADAAAEHAKEIKQLHQEYKNYLATADMTETLREIDRAQKVVDSKQKEIERLNKQKAETPQRISKMQNGYKYEVSNPEYEKIQQQIKKTEEELTRAQNRADVARERIKQIKEDSQKEASNVAAKTVELAGRMGTEWQDKLDAQIEGIEAQRKKSLEKLQEHASEVYGKNYKNEKAYLEEVAALNKYYDKKKLDEAKKQAEKEEAELKRKLAEQKAAAEKANNEIRSSLTNVSEWVHADDSETEKIEAEYRKAIESINKDFDVLIKNGVASETDCIEAVANIRKHYDKQIAEAREKAQKEYWQKEAENAAKQLREGNIDGKTVAKYSGATAVNSIEGTDLGNLLTAVSTAASAIMSLVAAVISCLLEIENVKKILNWAGTIVEKIFSFIGPIIDDTLAPLVELLETVGETIGQILTPLFGMIQILTTLSGLTTVLKVLSAVLKLVGGAFEWLYNNVIVPVGNKFVDIVNDIITLLNKLPWVNINKLEKLNYVGEMAEEMAEIAEKNLDAVKRKFERQKSVVESLLDAQLDALKSQYELGLISRQEYEKQAEKYAEEADSKIYDINSTMEKHLEAIENGTEEIEDFLSTSKKETATGLIGIGGGGQYVRGPVPPSSRILIADPVLERYQAERSQKYGQPAPYSVSVNVQGSVVTERELVDSVYQGIAKGIQSNRYNALGAA